MSTVVLVIVLGMVRMIGTNASTIFSQVGSALVVSGIQSARMRVRATDEARGDPIETVENTPESETIIALAYSVGRNLLVLKGVTQWSRPCERKISPNEIRGRTTEASSLRQCNASRIAAEQSACSRALSTPLSATPSHSCRLFLTTLLRCMSTTSPAAFVSSDYVARRSRLTRLREPGRRD
jgi:hypothetical protein